MNPIKAPGDAQLLIQILDNVADGITVQDQHGTLVFVNKAAAALLGYMDEAEVPQDSEQLRAKFVIFDEQERPLQFSDLPGRLTFKGVAEPKKIIGYRCPHQNGIRWSSVQAEPITGPDGQVKYAVNIMHDITELKETERQLREANERITKLLEQALDTE